MLSRLDEVSRRELLDGLNYLNLREIRSLCDMHGIPYRILVETSAGRTKRGKDTDRKPIVLDRVRHWLATGEVLPATCIKAHVVRDGPPPEPLQAPDRLYYRWYSKSYPSVMTVLEDLTGGRFENGALARVLIMEHWTSGEAPTLEDFGAEWVAAKDAGRDLLSSEYAVLTDLQRGTTGSDWKTMRTRKANRVLATIETLTR